MFIYIKHNDSVKNTKKENVILIINTVDRERFKNELPIL